MARVRTDVSSDSRSQLILVDRDRHRSMGGSLRSHMVTLSVILPGLAATFCNSLQSLQFAPLLSVLDRC